MAQGSTPVRRVTVSVQTPYDVDIGAGVLSGLGHAVRGASPGGSRVVLAVDAGLPEATVEAAASPLRSSGFTVIRHALIADEHHKSIEELARLLGAMAGCKLERGEPLVALGGGVVGDLAGFAAASYRRGVPFIQCPTTLLAMVDASVGGKTGINLRVGDVVRKNMAGAFHQPHAVLADVETLRTLGERHLRAGLAECVKHALLSGPLGDPTLFDVTTRAAAEVANVDGLVELIARNVALKARVVEADPREEAPDAVGGRALLNLGHTFGHAFEPVEGACGVLADGRILPAPMHHGEAVALGLIAATTAAELMGMAPTVSSSALRTLLTSLGLPVRARGLPSMGVLAEAMTNDKKAIGGVQRLVLPTKGFACKVVASPPRQAVEAGIDAILSP